MYRSTLVVTPPSRIAPSLTHSITLEQQDARAACTLVVRFTSARLGVALLGQPHPDRRRPRGGRRGPDRAAHGDRRVPFRGTEERVR